jgi:TRAP-type C4-dicarboxylate transport system permease small subunit
MTGTSENVVVEDDHGRPPENPVLRLADAACMVGAGAVLLAMMLMTFIDVAGRYFFKAPLGFAYEMTQLAMATVVFLALPSVSVRGLHVTTGLFENAFRGIGRVLRDGVIALAMAVCCFYITVRLARLAGRFDSFGEVTSVLRFPVGYVAWLGVGAFALSGVMILAALIAEVRRETGAKT